MAAVIIGWHTKCGRTAAHSGETFLMKKGISPKHETSCDCNRRKRVRRARSIASAEDHDIAGVEEQVVLPRSDERAAKVRAVHWRLVNKGSTAFLVIYRPVKCWRGG